MAMMMEAADDTDMKFEEPSRKRQTTDFDNPMNSGGGPSSVYSSCNINMLSSRSNGGSNQLDQDCLEDK